MRKLNRKKLKDVANNEKGQGMLEYILILVVVLAIAGMFRGKIMGWVNGLMGNAESSVNQFNSSGQ